MTIVKKIVALHLAAAILCTANAAAWSPTGSPAFQTKQKKKPETKSENCADEQPLNWKELEAEFDGIMEQAVDRAVNEALNAAVQEYEQQLQKERSKRQFWKQTAITQALVIAAGFFTGISVYTIMK